VAESRGPEQAAVPRTVIVAARLALLLVAAVAVLAGGSIALRDAGNVVAGARYECPMHPEVRSGKPGQCPICAMALELKVDRSGPSSMPGPPPGMADLTAVENVRKHKVLDFVRFRALPVEVRELRGAAWVEPDRTVSAVFYKDQAYVITAGDLATFSPTQTPETSVALRLASAPLTDWDSACALLHFELKETTPNQQAPALTPGQVGSLQVERKPRNVLAVSANAVLQSPEGPYVLRALGGFKFEKQRIEIAETFAKQGIAVVLSGLQPQDRVVARASFFLDADRRLASHSAEQDWGPR
jgi:hypothetical protein